MKAVSAAACLIIAVIVHVSNKRPSPGACAVGACGGGAGEGAPGFPGARGGAPWNHRNLLVLIVSGERGDQVQVQGQGEDELPELGMLLYLNLGIGVVRNQETVVKLSPAHPEEWEPWTNINFECSERVDLGGLPLAPGLFVPPLKSSALFYVCIRHACSPCDLCNLALVQAEFKPFIESKTLCPLPTSFSLAWGPGASNRGQSWACAWTRPFSSRVNPAFSLPSLNLSFCSSVKMRFFRAPAIAATISNTKLQSIDN